MMTKSREVLRKMTGVLREGINMMNIKNWEEEIFRDFRDFQGIPIILKIFILFKINNKNFKTHIFLQKSD